MIVQRMRGAPHTQRARTPREEQEDWGRGAREGEQKRSSEGLELDKLLIDIEWQILSKFGEITNNMFLELGKLKRGQLLTPGKKGSLKKSDYIILIH